MPQRMFEIDNVVELDDSAETGAAEYRKVALAEIGRESGFATARSVVDALLRELGWQPEYKSVEHPTFVPGRVAEISLGGKPIGVLGEVHPEVLTYFGLTYPVALAEITLQRVC
jgi:phenylalanyl-tRNA synthetase beta chain